MKRCVVNAMCSHYVVQKYKVNYKVNLTFILILAQCTDDMDAGACENLIETDPSRCHNKDFARDTCCASCKKPHWGPWSAWGPCSVNCGTGEMTKLRKCINHTQAPDMGCKGTGAGGLIREVATQHCFNNPCTTSM